MTRAAAEPLYARPVAERRGYLERVLDNVRIASPDALHGAAQLAPLAGLDFPALLLLADVNDAAIAAGADADLGTLARQRRLTETRLRVELARMTDGTTADPRGDTHAERLAWLALRGELWTAEVLLGAGGSLASVAARLRRLVQAHGASLPPEIPRLVADVVARLDARIGAQPGSPTGSHAGDQRPLFSDLAGPLVAAAGVEPLRGV